MTLSEGNTIIPSFSKAKKLARSVYSGHQTTLYCGCAYEGRIVDGASCGYRFKKTDIGARRMEWEHVVPAEAFGQSFKAWREGHPDCVHRGKKFKGRNCARKVEPLFRLMESDLYNLYPAIGEVNRKRSNRAMAMISGPHVGFNGCPIEFRRNKVEPKPDIRVDVARTYQYMDSVYPGRGIVSGKNKKLFEAWSKQDPVDAWECERARRVERIQLNRNAVVAESCKGRE